MNALPALEGRVLLCHCPAGMRCHGVILISLWLDRYAVKQVPRSCASFPDPLPSSAGGLSGPQVSARNACDKLQQESEAKAEKADAGLKQVLRSLLLATTRFLSFLSLCRRCPNRHCLIML